MAVPRGVPQALGVVAWELSMRWSSGRGVLALVVEQVILLFLL
jgi:hypothetical protein